MARLVWVIQTATKDKNKLKGRIKKYKRTEIAQFEVPFSSDFAIGDWVEVSEWGGTAGTRKATKIKKLK
ncbi:hypothetical protein KY325_05195 [Candidatus Woesearchaeota archaeon]|nr:hypothetical protein [Candidatus Woesearchaeota archaeon]MBW3018530.1 hypothetical protein [Candidatus Woesearchaeota archaeon]